MTFFDVLTFPMSILCITRWDIYVFSHETSETVENIWLTNYIFSKLHWVGSSVEHGNGVADGYQVPVGPYIQEQKQQHQDCRLAGS